MFARYFRKFLIQLLVLSICACGSSQKKRHITPNYDPDVVRYRLPMRHNPVDKGEAFRCYGGCQSELNPDLYVECLSECPGFEVTPGFACADFEIPPHTACFTARKVKYKSKSEVSPGMVVLSVIAGFAVIVSASAVCATAQSPNCGSGFYW